MLIGACSPTPPSNGRGRRSGARTTSSLRALVDEALELIGATDPARRAMLLAVLASYRATFEGLSGAAVDSLADEALALADSVGDDALRYEVLIHHLAILQGSADLDRQRRVLDELEELQQRPHLGWGGEPLRSHEGAARPVEPVRVVDVSPLPRPARTAERQHGGLRSRHRAC